MKTKPNAGVLYWIWTRATDVIQAVYIGQNHTWHTWELTPGERIKTNGLPQLFDSKVNACWWALQHELRWIARNNLSSDLSECDTERVYKRCCDYHRAFVDQLSSKGQPNGEA